MSADLSEQVSADLLSAEIMLPAEIILPPDVLLPAVGLLPPAVQMLALLLHVVQLAVLQFAVPQSADLLLFAVLQFAVPQFAVLQSAAPLLAATQAADLPLFAVLQFAVQQSAVQQFAALLLAVLHTVAEGEDENSCTQITIENYCDKEIGVDRSKGLVHWSMVCQLQQCISNLSLVNILSKTKTHTICNVLNEIIIIILYLSIYPNSCKLRHFLSISDLNI